MFSKLSPRITIWVPEAINWGVLFDSTRMGDAVAIKTGKYIWRGYFEGMTMISGFDT